jgi:hypothetical protein
MIRRISTGVALTGMLLATGCGGGTGSSGVSAPITGSGAIPVPGPAAPGTTLSSRRTVSVSALVPRPRAGVSTAGAARKPKYVSPGTSAISVFIRGNTAGAASVVKVLDQIPIPAAPTSVASQAFSFLANVSGSVFTGCTTDGCAVSYSWAPSTAAGYYLFTINFTGLLQTAGGEHIAQPWTELPGGYTFGFVLQDTVNNGFVLSEGEVSAPTIASVGPTPVSLTLNPVIGSGFLCDATCSGNLPVPLTASITGNADVTHVTAFTLLTTGVSVTQAAAAFPGGTLAVTPPTTATTIANFTTGPLSGVNFPGGGSSYEVAAYVGDELGYLIPGSQTFDAGGKYTVAECADGATPGIGCGNPPGILSITTCPVTASIAATAAVGGVNPQGLDPLPATCAALVPLADQTSTTQNSGAAGVLPLVKGLAIPASGGVGPPVPATAGLGVSAGLSVNVQCKGVGKATLAIVATEPSSGQVVGFHYSNFEPKNFPVSGIVSTPPSASQGGPLGAPPIGNTLSVNCSPGAGITIN